MLYHLKYLQGYILLLLNREILVLLCFVLIIIIFIWLFAWLIPCFSVAVENIIRNTSETKSLFLLSLKLSFIYITILRPINTKCTV